MPATRSSWPPVTTTEGADEVVFYDITASARRPPDHARVVARTSEEVFIPLTVGGGVRSLEDARRLLAPGRRQGERQLGGGGPARAGAGNLGHVRRPVRRRRDRHPPRPRAAGGMAGVHPRRPCPDGPRRSGLGRPLRAARGGRTGPQFDGPGRHQAGLRPGADPPGSGRDRHPHRGQRRGRRPPGPGRRGGHRQGGRRIGGVHIPLPGVDHRPGQGGAGRRRGDRAAGRRRRARRDRTRARVACRARAR